MDAIDSLWHDHDLWHLRRVLFPPDRCARVARGCRSAGHDLPLCPIEARHAEARALAGGADFLVLRGRHLAYLIRAGVLLSGGASVLRRQVSIVCLLLIALDIASQAYACP